MACFLLFTLLLPPDFNLPCLYSFITLPTLVWALLLYLRPPLEEEDCERLDFFLAEAERLPLLEVLLRVPVAPRLLRLFVPAERLRPELDFFAVAIK